MDFNTATVRFSEVQDEDNLADLYSKIYTIPKPERVKVLMSWLANAYSDLLIPVLSESETLSTFTVHVKLLDSFCNNSSYEIVAQLASEFSDGFLTAQVIPNLIENHDAACDTTFYLQTISENLTCPTLIRKVVDLVTKELAPVINARLKSQNQAVVASTLGLIKTLLEFYCEDLWYELILQYLLPMKHLLTSDRQKLLPEIEFYESTHKILEQIPNFVIQNTDPELLARHFHMYYHDEIVRLRVIDTTVAASTPSSKSDLIKVGLSPSEDEASEDSADQTGKRGKNQTYPMWVYRYDGTDFLHAFRKGFIHEDPEEFFEDDLFSVSNQLEQSNIMSSEEENENGNGTSADDIINGILSRSPDSLEGDSGVRDLSAVTTISNSTQPKSSVTDKRNSILREDDDGYNCTPYFGPFLQVLFEILKNWTSFQPDVLFIATEIISVLASSRIPLITSIFLDLSLTLQPSYPRFSDVLHSLRTELDEQLSKYPDFIFRSVWKAAAKDCSLQDFYNRNSSYVSSEDDSESSPSVLGRLRRSLSNSASIRMATEEVQKSMKIGRNSSFRAFAGIFKSPNANQSPEFRLLNRSAMPFENEEEEQEAKLMALRGILFTHWMLELAAISMQLSWGRRPVHCKPEVRVYNDVANAVPTRTGNYVI